MVPRSTVIASLSAVLLYAAPLSAQLNAPPGARVVPQPSSILSEAFGTVRAEEFRLQIGRAHV